MGYICAAKGYGNNTARQKGVYRFFRIPAIITNRGEKVRKLSEDRRRKWQANLYRKDLDDKKANITRVCSKYFVSGQPADLFDTTNPDWVTITNLGHNNIKSVTTAISRNARFKERQNKKLVQSTELNKRKEKENIKSSLDDELPSSSQGSEPYGDMECGVNTGTCTNMSKYCQTDLDMETIKRNENCMQVITEELTLAKSQLLIGQMSKKSFENNDELTKFYTGIPKFEVLNHVFNLVQPYVKTTSQNALNPFQEFILVLIRLKLHPPLQDLAFRFNISVPTTSRVFAG